MRPVYPLPAADRRRPAQRRLVTAIGARAGWWVTGAPDIEAAQRILRDPEAPKIDAILLDHWLPGPAGAALIEQIRAERPDLPLLVLTAQTSVAVAVDAMRAGANDFLVKPIAPDRLLAALNAATDRRQRGRELRPLSEKISKPMASTRSSARRPASARPRHRAKAARGAGLGADRGRGESGRARK